MSLVCAELVHADMPKTRTVFTAKVILRRGSLPRAVWRRATGAAAHLPAWFLRARGWGEGRPIIATARSPFDWYGSWYEHMMREDRDTLKALSGGSLDFSSVLLGALEPHDEWPAHPLGLGVSPSELGVDIEPEPLWTMATRWYTEQADRVFIDITLADLAAFGLVDDLGPKNVTPPGRAPLTVEQHAAIEVADGPYWAELQARTGDA